MGYYRKIFSNSIAPAGAAGESYLMPPDGAFTKIGFQVYEALDLICEGPTFGLVDQKGVRLAHFKEFPASIPKPVNQESFDDGDTIGVNGVGFTAANTNGGTARVYVPIDKDIKISDLSTDDRQSSNQGRLEIEFVASSLSGSTYTVELVSSVNSTTQRSVEKHNVVNGANVMVFELSGTTKAVMFEVSGNSGITVSGFILRQKGFDHRAIKNFDDEANFIGSSTRGVDKGIYFNDVPLRDEQNQSQIGKYSVSEKRGFQYQTPHPTEFGKKPHKLTVLGIPIKGPYDMGADVRTAAAGSDGSDINTVALVDVTTETNGPNRSRSNPLPDVSTFPSLYVRNQLLPEDKRRDNLSDKTFRFNLSSINEKAGADMDSITALDEIAERGGAGSVAPRRNFGNVANIDRRVYQITVNTSDDEVINLIKRNPAKEAVRIKFSGFTGTSKTSASRLNFVSKPEYAKIFEQSKISRGDIFRARTIGTEVIFTIARNHIKTETDGSYTFYAFGSFLFEDPDDYSNVNKAAFSPAEFTSSSTNAKFTVENAAGSGGGGGIVGGSPARNGSGSRDVRTEGGEERDFVTWQKFVPLEKLAKPYKYVNYDSNIDKVTIMLQIDALNDTKSFADEKENKDGTSRLGTLLPAEVSVKVVVGKVNKDGVATESNAQFTTRARGAINENGSNGILAVEGIITQPYTISMEEIQLPELNETDLYNFVRVEKQEFETLSNLINRDIAVKTISEITDIIFKYPYSSTVATSIDSRYYPTVPERTFRLKGKMILIPSNYTPIDPSGTDKRFSSDTSTRGNVIYDGPWDGTFKFGWSDNPAWIYYDLLINTRYGLGSYIRDLDIIDKWSLFEIGQYCDAVTVNDGSRTSSTSGVGVFIGLDDGNGGLEPRFSSNLLFKDQTNAFDALKNLAKSFRAMSFYDNSTMSIRVDQPHFYTDFNRDTAYANSIAASGVPEPPKELKFPPHLFFNNGNVIDGTFNYSDVDKVNRLSAIEVSFLDKSTNYSSATEYVENGELIKKYGLNVTQINGVGVTSRSQAHRFGKYALFESANSTETVSFTAGYEALMLTPGDIIQVNDELKDFSKSYGTVLATSGEVVYFDPDDASTGQATIASGIGPKAILVKPAIGSTQLDRIGSGNIHIYNPIGQSGSNEFYKTDSASTDTKTGYSAIHEPQMISLKLREGGNGSTYHVVGDSVLFHIDVSGIFKAGGENTLLPSQWFAESRPGTRSRKNANLIGGSSYSIDVGGIVPKYYRVMSVSENDEKGYEVTALIHHADKFKFVEENTYFDEDPDTFDPDLKLTAIATPDPPDSVTVRKDQKTANSDGSLNIPIDIADDTFGTSNEKVNFKIILEKPNFDIIERTFRNRNSQNEKFVLGESIDGIGIDGFSRLLKIDQIGTYNVNVFSEVSNPVFARSLTAASASFEIVTSDFGFSTSTDSFIEYSNISLLTNFNTNYDQDNDLGTGQNSFFENDSEINATLNVSFKDIFGVSGSRITNQVLEQRVDILNSTGAVVARNFKVLGNDEQIQITNSGLESAFGVASIELDNSGNLTKNQLLNFSVPEGLKFQGGFFELSGADVGTEGSTLRHATRTGNFVPFETSLDESGNFVTGFYEKNPVVLVQKIVEGSFKDANGLVKREQPIGRVLTEPTGFVVANGNTHKTRYCYFASPTGVFTIDNNVIQVGSGIMPSDQADFQTVTFSEEFSSIPKVIVQVQNAAHTGNRRSQGVELLDDSSAYGVTTTKEVSTTSFKFGSFNESGKPNGFTGVFGYVATNIETFNIRNDSPFSINTINMSTSKINSDTASYKMTGTPVLTNTNAIDTRFNNKEQMLFVQNTGLIHTGEHFVVHRVGTGNLIISHPMKTGMPGVSGFRTMTNNSGNKISLEFASGIGSVGQPKILPEFLITSDDIVLLNQRNGNIFRGEQTVGSYVDINKADIRLKSLTITDPGSNLTDSISITVSNPGMQDTTGITIADGETHGSLSAGDVDGGAPTFQVNLSSGSVQEIIVTNSGSNRFRPTMEALFSDGGESYGVNWTVNVGGGGPSTVIGAPQLTGNIHIATMVNVPSNATNQMFILDNVFSGKRGGDGETLIPNINKSGFAFFLSGSDANPYLHLDGTDYKLSNTKINDGENHFIEAHLNREHISHVPGDGQDEILGYVDGNSGILHSFDQGLSTINYMFSGSMCLFNNSGRHQSATNPSFAFNSGLIIDAVAMFTGRERFGSQNSPHTGSLYKAQYKTGLGAFINLHETGTKTFMLTTFTGSTFKNGILGDRGYNIIRHGDFEKTDIISRRIDGFDFDIMQIGNTGTGVLIY